MIGVSRPIIRNCVHRRSAVANLHCCIHVIEPTRRLLEYTYRAGRRNHLEMVALGTVVHDLVAFRLHPCERRNVCNAVWVIPDLAVAREVAHKPCHGHSCSAVNVHAGASVSDVFEQAFVLEHIDGRLAVKQDPDPWNIGTPSSLERKAGSLVEELETHDHVFKVFLLLASFNDGGGDKGGSSLSSRVAAGAT